MSKPRCKNCGGKLQLRGRYKSDPSKTRTWCQRCNNWNYIPSRHPRPAKILLLDIETLPAEYYSWSPDPRFLSPEMQKKPWSIACWAAKWLFDPEIMGEVVSADDAENREDGKILGGMWKLVDEANIVITQNGVKFDMPSLNTRWVTHGYKPPSYYRNVDTLLTAQKKFRFTYNRLEELGMAFGIGRKMKMDFTDWKSCLEGSKKDRQDALDKMLVYCKRDVAPLLEDVYLYMLPWMDNHPNLNIYSDSDVCRNCGSTSLVWTEEYPTPQGLWEGWRCPSCGAIGRGHGKDHKIRGTKLT